MQRALIFPGQGGQTVGMGQALYETFPEAREVLDEIDSTLGKNLTEVMFNGPQEKLNLAENTRPAVFGVSVAVARVLEKQSGKPLAAIADCIAGHSVGEYSALCAVGTFELADTVKFLKRNTDAIQQEVPVGVGSMGVLFDINRSQAEEISVVAGAQGEICAVANDNGPKQIVVSGHSGAVKRAVEIATNKYGGSGMLLPVSIPGHSPLLANLEKDIRDSLIVLYKGPPALPWISNATAQTASGRIIVPSLLAYQVSRPVRWHESVLHMTNQGVNHYVECGAGKLSGLVRQIDPNAVRSSLQNPKGIEIFFEGRVIPRRKPLPAQIPLKSPGAAV